MNFWAELSCEVIMKRFNKKIYSVLSKSVSKPGKFKYMYYAFNSSMYLLQNSFISIMF